MDKNKIPTKKGPAGPPSGCFYHIASKLLCGTVLRVRLLNLCHELSPVPLGLTRLWALPEIPSNPFRFVKIQRVRRFLRSRGVEISLGGCREGDVLEVPDAGAVYATQTYRLGEVVVKTTELATADGKVFTFNQTWSRRSGMHGESRDPLRLIAPIRMRFHRDWKTSPAWFDGSSDVLHPS